MLGAFELNACVPALQGLWGWRGGAHFAHVSVSHVRQHDVSASVDVLPVHE